MASGSSGVRSPPSRASTGSSNFRSRRCGRRSSSAFSGSILTRHRFGEHTLFIGDSNDVSRVVGIDVDREKIKIFTLMGFLAACAAIMLTLENKNFFGNQGQGYLLTAIASVLIGGTSIFGGQATILGTVFGCLIIGMIEAGLVACGPHRRLGPNGAGSHLPDRDYLLHVRGRTAAPAGVARQSAVVSEIRQRTRLPNRDGSAARGGPEQRREKRTCVCPNLLLAGVAAAAVAAVAGPASAADPIGKGLVMYMQMGGNAGDGATLARQTGAKEAAEALGVDLKSQFSKWEPETMINQFKEAMAAKPNCIEIMGHPGSTAFHDLVKQAVDQGIVVTSGNSPLTDLQKEFGPKGFGYAGVDLYAGGALTANAMLAQGLKAGDEAVVWGIFSQAERGQSEKGLADTLEKAGLKVDRLDIPQEVNSDPSLGIPQFAAYIQAHPNLKAIGLQHGNITGIMSAGPEESGQEARRDHRRRHRPRSRDDRRAEVRLCQRDARPAALPAGLRPGRAVRDDRQVQDAGPVAQHRRGHRHAEDDRRADQADRRGHPLTRTDA